MSKESLVTDKPYDSRAVSVASDNTRPALSPLDQTGQQPGHQDDFDVTPIETPRAESQPLPPPSPGLRFAAKAAAVGLAGFAAFNAGGNSAAHETDQLRAANRTLAQQNTALTDELDQTSQQLVEGQQDAALARAVLEAQRVVNDLNGVVRADEAERGALLADVKIYNGSVRVYPRSDEGDISPASFVLDHPFILAESDSVAPEGSSEDQDPLQGAVIGKTVVDAAGREVVEAVPLLDNYVPTPNEAEGPKLIREVDVERQLVKGGPGKAIARLVAYDQVIDGPIVQGNALIHPGQVTEDQTGLLAAVGVGIRTVRR